MITRNQYLEMIFDDFCKGRITAEEYDLAFMNIDEFTEEIREEEEN